MTIKTKQNNLIIIYKADTNKCTKPCNSNVQINSMRRQVPWAQTTALLPRQWGQTLLLLRPGNIQVMSPKKICSDANPWCLWMWPCIGSQQIQPRWGHEGGPESNMTGVLTRRKRRAAQRCQVTRDWAVAGASQGRPTINNHLQMLERGKEGFYQEFWRDQGSWPLDSGCQYCGRWSHPACGISLQSLREPIQGFPAGHAHPTWAVWWISSPKRLCDANYSKSFSLAGLPWFTGHQGHEPLPRLPCFFFWVSSQWKHHSLVPKWLKTEAQR